MTASPDRAPEPTSGPQDGPEAGSEGHVEGGNAAGPGGDLGPVAFEDPAYREAVVDLLGAIGYGEISAFERLAEDAKLAPTLEDKVAIASMATVEFGHVARIRDRPRGVRGAPPPAAVPLPGGRR